PPISPASHAAVVAVIDGAVKRRFTRESGAAVDTLVHRHLRGSNGSGLPRLPADEAFQAPAPPKKEKTAGMRRRPPRGERVGVFFSRSAAAIHGVVAIRGGRGSGCGDPCGPGWHDGLA